MTSEAEARARQPISERTVEVHIENHSKSQVLFDAATYNYSGHSYNPAPPVISPGEKGDAMFVKTKSAARGSVGILSYKFGASQFSLMFSNPFDYNLYSIEFALYVTNTPEFTDKHLYRQMYSQLTPQKNYAKQALGAKSEAISVTGGGLIISATMSNESHSMVKIDVRDV